MSVTLILIPAALAAATAISAAGGIGALSQLGREQEADETAGALTESGPRPIEVRTRMKDPDLLGDALRDIGATGVTYAGDELSASIEGVELAMTRSEDGVWAAHFQRADGRELAEAEAAELVARLDAAYALRVQQAVAARIRDRAASAGFELVSESRDDDDTVTMVLDVKDYA
ncbi:hypothetical protein [Microbacterium kyungheense]|uniref:DUF1257 domain-containing protein n=1 Tax=Microbacterium kyungheense TaxID=1263636 RepID=A0A543ESD5_9MICO|nr:hypothetical protein [Microbacterium kyungheense]TQM24485.1 hypothetical protein FB391_3001 [Microbacterium kyungheense]